MIIIIICAVMITTSAVFINGVTIYCTFMPVDACQMRVQITWGSSSRGRSNKRTIGPERVGREITR